MVRRHRVEGVLCQARHLYAEYLRRHQQKMQDEEIRQLEGENEKLIREQRQLQQQKQQQQQQQQHRLAPVPMPATVGDLGISV